MRARERRPSHGAPSKGNASRQAAESTSESTAPDPGGRSASSRRSPFAQNWPRVVERRRAQRELDQLLGCDRYPDVRLAYGLRGGDDGFC